MLGRILALILKELQVSWRDKKSRVVLIAPTIMETIIFSFAATMEVTNVSVAVLNQDNGHESYQLVQRLRASSTLSHFSYLDGVQQIAPILDAQEALLVVHIPVDFSRSIRRGESGCVQVILDGRRTNAAQIVLGYVNQIVDGYARELGISTRASQAQPVIVARSWFNPNKDYRWFTVLCLVGTITTLEALILTGLSVARERELGTFEQLLVSPLQPLEIMVGKTVPPMMIGVAQGTFVLVLAVTVFHVPFHGTPWLLYLGMGANLLAVVGVGLFISSLAATQQQALLGVFFVMVPIILLSGFATPRENMPDWLQSINVSNPLAYFLVIVNGVVLKDMPFPAVCERLWPLAIIACLTLTLAAWLFRRRLA
ncbi:MAG: ABC transporter permease [Planctomycetota bacterium]|nr:ABC transporter permease [Planctomycetota bacterium]